ncbi:hypothetical protein RHMOL_Rhmol07G0055700 [Rhododendron molle]|uniref:Uncharacterized protein n=1 Tax=Rhododendron molle TaxID=49168 RepID=A0ACC0MX80_RHOML|nr:hypothetical protein RHMOL_Rhmol07G0055700 [Rhododendron molle]
MELKESRFANLTLAKLRNNPRSSMTSWSRSFYLTCQSLPVKIVRALPSSSVPVILSYCGKNWDMVYLGGHSLKRIDSGWKTFAHDNDIKVGDACVFELMESSSDVFKFRVQILRGDFPPELEERVNGETSNTPVVLD